ncbi:MoxR family ATPase [Angustibacter speluncae]
MTFPVAELAARIDEAVQRAVVGRPEAVADAVTCLLAGGHLLIEDVPGVGKTTLARAVAEATGGTWHRLQFTPDLLPGDVTGVSVWDESARRFEFRPGPVFAHVVVADEINRAAPKTQSALLEVMQEHQVTVDSVSHPVPQPFLVVATQNPVDLAGTYPLPEAQLDRFLLRVEVGYPSAATEAGLLVARVGRTDDVPVAPVCTPDDVRRAQQAVASVHVHQEVADDVVALVGATRTHPALRLGASPRASLALVRAAQARAATAGRDYVVPDDVRALAVQVLAHRLLLSADGELSGHTREQAVRDVMEQVVPPTSGVAR